MAEILLLWILFSLLIAWMVAFAILALRRSDGAKPEQETVAQSYKLPVPKAAQSKQPQRMAMFQSQFQSRFQSRT